MNREEFISKLRNVLRTPYSTEQNDPKLESYLRNLKNHFDEDQVTEIEDYVFGLSNITKSFSPEQFYEYLQTEL